MLGPKSDYTNYKEYIASNDWRKKREKAFELLGRKCKGCGGVENLEVHHLNYENLYNESVLDVEIQCSKCHPLSDTQREIKKSYDTWLRNKYEDCVDVADDEYEYEKFLNWYYRDK